MTEAVLTKIKGALLPANDDAKELLNAMPVGEELLISYKQGRSVQNHRRFFTFVNYTFDWQDTYHNKDIWIYVLKVLGGHFHLVIDKRGNTQYVAKSINFGAVDETEFKEFFNCVIEGYLKSDYAKGLTPEQLTLITQY